MRGLAIAAFIAAFWSAAWATSPAPQPLNEASATKQDASAAHRGTEQSPLVVNIKAIPPPTEEERREKAEEHQQKVETDTWLVRLTGVLAVATLALVVATWFLWNATRRLVKGAEDTAKKQLRAYLHVSRVHAVYQPDNGPLMVRLDIKNFGQTPAYQVIQWISVGGTKTADPLVVEPLAINERKSVANVGPGLATYFEQPTSDRISPAKKSSLIDGTSTMHVYGEVTYKDVFGDSHFTKFRMYMSGNGATEGKFKPSDTGNETDDFPQSAADRV